MCFSRTSQSIIDLTSIRARSNRLFPHSIGGESVSRVFRIHPEEAWTSVAPAYACRSICRHGEVQKESPAAFRVLPNASLTQLLELLDTSSLSVLFAPFDSLRCELVLGVVGLCHTHEYLRVYDDEQDKTRRAFDKPPRFASQ